MPETHPQFGWVMQPAPATAAGAATLNEDNLHAALQAGDEETACRMANCPSGTVPSHNTSLCSYFVHSLTIERKQRPS